MRGKIRKIRKITKYRYINETTDQWLSLSSTLSPTDSEEIAKESQDHFFVPEGWNRHHESIFPGGYEKTNWIKAGFWSLSWGASSSGR